MLYKYPSPRLVFSYFGYVARSGIARSYSNPMFSFKGTAKLFHTGYTIYMYSYQQHTRVSVFVECYFKRTVKVGLNCLPILLNAMRMVIALLIFWFTLKNNFLFLCTNLECIIKNKQKEQINPWNCHQYKHFLLESAHGEMPLGFLIFLLVVTL